MRAVPRYPETDPISGAQETAMRTTSLVAVVALFANAYALGAAENTGILNATSPSPGILFSGQPTAEQLQKLGAENYKTVIDLRRPDEDRGFDEPSVAKAAGLAYYSVPVKSDELDKPETLDKFIELFSKVEKPVLVHCGVGSRVAAVYYGYLVAKEGMSREEALAKAKEQGLRNESLVAPVDVYLDKHKAKQD
jgi:uncharacterized protein (TIGR01244 family)